MHLIDDVFDHKVANTEYYMLGMNIRQGNSHLKQVSTGACHIRPRMLHPISLMIVILACKKNMDINQIVISIEFLLLSVYEYLAMTPDLMLLSSPSD